ncbi:MAG: hypothetical protein IPI81_12805 [Flavobacteriales bacterium]|nr:hypothetical protein [Flavobacteriales bacterium]MCC6937978.1 hypothetical protein [Flavobacteriales bacterium]
MAMVFIVASVASAQSDELYFQRAFERELPGSRILSLSEDPIGGLWVGTSSGLARVLGDHVRVWRQQADDSLSLSSSHIVSVDATSPDVVWVGTLRGLCRLDPITGAVKRVPCHLPDTDPLLVNTIWQVVCGHEGSIWVSTAAGLLNYDAVASEWRDPLVEEAVFPGSRMRPLPGTMVHDARRKALWAGTKYGVYRLDETGLRTATDTLRLEPMQGTSSAMCLAAGLHDDIAVLDFRLNAMLHIHPDIGVVRSVKLPSEWFFNNLGKAMLVDPTQRIWIATGDDRLRVLPANGKDARSIVPDRNKPWSLPSSSVNALLLTREKTLWLGTEEGLVRLLPERSGQIHLANWNSPSVVNAIESDANGLLLASNGEGMIRLDPRTGRTDTIRSGLLSGTGGSAPAAMEDMITDLLRMSDGWLIGTRAGLRWWPDGSSHVHVPYPPTASIHLLSERSVEQVRKNAKGVVWVRTFNHGIWRIAPGTEAKRVAIDGSDDATALGRLTCMAIDPNGGPWCGTASGYIVKLDGEGRITRTIRLLEGSRMAAITAVHPTDSGGLWAAADDGSLSMIGPDGAVLRTFTHEDGLPSGTQHTLRSAPHTGLWMMSETGLAHIDPAREPAVMSIPLFNHWGRPTTIAAPYRDGVLLACSQALVSVRTPVHVADNNLQAVFAALERDGRSLPCHPLHSELEVPYSQRTLRIHFTALGSDRPEELEFRYRLGPDRKWIDLKGSRTLDLIDLHEGTYRVELIALGRDRQPNGRSAVLDLVIHPPWYRSSWAISLAVIIVLLLAFLMFRSVLRSRLRKERERVTREQAVLLERIRIAHDLHDDLGSGLASIGMDSDLAGMEAADPVAREALKRVSEGARNVGDDMRRIVWAMSSGQETVGDLVAYIRGLAGEILDHGGVELEFEQDIARPTTILSVDQRKHLVLFAKEALHNVVKHAGASRVSMTIVRTSAEIRVRIQDNGRGFDPDRMERTGTGTLSMRERARALGGTLHIESSAATGTSLDLGIPASLPVF